ncbi:MAG: aromatic amino acid DMT transporter YddG [Phycisphaerae bacterium]|nr:aromatic amino acid DMT transporter YddG [Phycisphaerae bacterium]
MTAQPTRSSDRVSTGGGLVALLIWSTTMAVSRGMAESLGTVTGAALATGAGGLVALTVAWMQGVRPARMVALPLKYLLGCGGIFVLYVVCMYTAVGWAPNRSTVLVVGLVNYLWPALTVVLSIPILHYRARWWIVPGCIVAVCGTGLATIGGEVFSVSELSEAGAGLAVPLGLAAVAAVAWALYSNLARRWGRAQIGAVPLFLLASSGVLWLLRTGQTETTTWTVKSVAELGFISVAQSALAYGLWERGMRRGNHLLLAVVSYFTPIVSTAVAAVYLQVTPGPSLLFGCILVGGGALMCKLSVTEQPCVKDAVP